MSITAAIAAVDKARRAGWTDVRIGEAAGVSRGQISRLVKRKHDPSPETIAALVAFGKHWKAVENPIEV